MLESTGYTSTDAARSLFSTPSVKCENRTASEQMEHLLAHPRSNAKSMEEFTNVISMGYVAAHIGAECADYVDLQKPKTTRE